MVHRQHLRCTHDTRSERTHATHTTPTHTPMSTHTIKNYRLFFRISASNTHTRVHTYTQRRQASRQQRDFFLEKLALKYSKITTFLASLQHTYPNTHQKGSQNDYASLKYLKTSIETGMESTLCGQTIYTLILHNFFFRFIFKVL